MVKRIVLLGLFLLFFSGVFFVSAYPEKEIFFVVRCDEAPDNEVCNPVGQLVCNETCYPPQLTADFNSGRVELRVANFNPATGSIYKRIQGASWSTLDLADAMDSGNAFFENKVFVFLDFDVGSATYDYKAGGRPVKYVVPATCIKGYCECETQNCSYAYSGIVSVSTIKTANPVFSLTGTIKDFSGTNLNGYFKDFNLSKDSTKMGFDSAQHSFGNGFFNFSFGRQQQVFPELKALQFGFFDYFLSFRVTALSPVSLSDLLKAEITLLDDESVCPEGICLMEIPFNGRIKDSEGQSIQNGTVKNIEIKNSLGETVFEDAMEKSFSDGMFSTVIEGYFYPNSLYGIEFDVCDNSGKCDSFSFQFFTWKRLSE